jgi:hypothetical protein
MSTLREVEYKINFFELTFKPFTRKVKGNDGTVQETKLYSIQGNMLNSDKSFDVTISEKQFLAFGLSEFNVSASIPRVYRVKFAAIFDGAAYRDIDSGNLVAYQTRNPYHFESLLPMTEGSETLKAISNTNSLQMKHLASFETLYGVRYDSGNEEHRSIMLQLMKG